VNIEKNTQEKNKNKNPIINIFIKVPIKLKGKVTTIKKNQHSVVFTLKKKKN
jgi:hypothetical protein